MQFPDNGILYSISSQNNGNITTAEMTDKLYTNRILEFSCRPDWGYRARGAVDFIFALYRGTKSPARIVRSHVLHSKLSVHNQRGFHILWLHLFLFCMISYVHFSSFVLPKNEPVSTSETCKNFKRNYEIWFFFFLEWRYGSSTIVLLLIS